MIEMSQSYSFTVSTFLYNYSLSEDQNNFKSVTTSASHANSLISEVRKSYLLARRLLIKTFGSSNSPRLEIEKLQNLQCILPLDILGYF